MVEREEIIRFVEDRLGFTPHRRPSFGGIQEPQGWMLTN